MLRGALNRMQDTGFKRNFRATKAAKCILELCRVHGTGSCSEPPSPYAQAPPSYNIQNQGFTLWILKANPLRHILHRRLSFAVAAL